MKTSKTFYWSLLLLPVLFSGFGCKKFLDRKPLTATLQDLHQGSLESQSLGLYSTLKGDAGFSVLPWLDFQSIRDDDAEKGSNQTDGHEINAEFENFNYSKDDWAPNSYWDDHFSVINLANNELADARDLMVTDEPSLRNVGEACFFRAYAYFELVKTYGSVPIVNYRVNVPADAIQPKRSVDSVYAFIDSNLYVAASYLPANSETYGTGYRGRLTSGAANTLFAQAFLFRQKWDSVVKYCNAVINSGQYTLTPDFKDIWADGLAGAGKNGPESIWEMNAWDEAGAASNGNLDFGTNWGTCQQVRQGGAPIAWNLGWGWNTPTQHLVDAWDSTDPRKSKTILYSGQYDGGTAEGGYGATLPLYDVSEANGGIARKYWNKKVYSDPAMRQFTGFINNNGGAPWINHRILRYADVLLMLAEASNELGDGATAEAMLEMVRDRASGNLGSARTIVPKVTFSGQAQMRTAIKNERRWEFAMEGYRFYDLVRWGDAQSVLSSLGYTNRARYYPIPQKAIDLAGGVLVQNPEW